MSRNVFSPLEIRELFLTSSDFGLDQGPADSMEIKMEFSLNEEPEEVTSADEDSDLHVQSLQLSVRVCLVSGEEQQNQHMHASSTVHIKTACNASKNAAGVSDYMRMSSISIAYGHARSWISSMTSMSPMGLFLIPAVDPKALLENIAEDNQ